jgi:uncharacterized protein YfaA (DUF2138 family)
MLLDRYRASPLARWLLRSNALGTDLQKTRHVTATHCYVTSPQTQRKHCSNIVGRVWCGRCLAMDLHVTVFSRDVLTNKTLNTLNTNTDQIEP